MFLSRTTKSAGGADYSYWNLCVTERTARGPRRRVVASLGKLDEAEINSLQGSWDDLTALLRGESVAPAAVKTRPRAALLPGFAAPAAPESPAAPDTQPQHPPRDSRGWELADASGVRVERCRDFGQCYLALSLWHRLGLLYDVTSTYFEGACEGNEQAQRGYSRDHRPDCKQVCIGLVCTPEGLPLSFEVFAGNRNDVTTVEQIVLAMEQKYGVAQRVWVMDRGMVSEANLAFLRARKARYLVGTPKSWLRKHEQSLLEKDNWHEVREGLEVRLVEHPGGEPGERYVLCRGNARAEKERAILARQSERLTSELLKIDAWLRRTPQTDLEAVGRRIGKHQGKNPAAAAIIEARLEQDAQGRACALNISSRLAEGQKAHRQKGAYLLRTNCEELDPVQLWKWYVQLTQAEAAFRTSKSDLGLRPVFHHKKERVQAHILVCFLALAMWRALEQWMRAKTLGTCARQLVKEMAGIKSMDVIIPVKRGEEETRLRVRVVSTPEAPLAQLLGHLGLRLPKARILANVVPKNTP